MKFLHEPESDDPILSVGNLIDIFLVIIAALLITVAQNPMLNVFRQQDVTVITDADGRQERREDREIPVDRSGRQWGWRKAGVAYRMKDGSMVYVTEGGWQGVSGCRREAVP